MTSDDHGGRRSVVSSAAAPGSVAIQSASNSSITTHVTLPESHQYATVAIINGPERIEAGTTYQFSVEIIGHTGEPATAVLEVRGIAPDLCTFEPPTVELGKGASAHSLLEIRCQTTKPEHGRRPLQVAAYFADRPDQVAGRSHVREIVVAAAARVEQTAGITVTKQDQGVHHLAVPLRNAGNVRQTICVDAAVHEDDDPEAVQVVPGPSIVLQPGEQKKLTFAISLAHRRWIPRLWNLRLIASGSQDPASTDSTTIRTRVWLAVEIWDPGRLPDLAGKSGRWLSRSQRVPRLGLIAMVLVTVAALLLNFTGRRSTSPGATPVQATRIVAEPAAADRNKVVPALVPCGRGVDGWIIVLHSAPHKSGDLDDFYAQLVGPGHEVPASRASADSSDDYPPDQLKISPPINDSSCPGWARTTYAVYLGPVATAGEAKGICNGFGWVADGDQDRCHGLSLRYKANPYEILPGGTLLHQSR